MSAELVALSGVTVVREGATLLADVDWVVNPGEHWVVFGANGSGKTTLMEVVSSYLYPTRGEVTILGERLGRTDARLLRSRIGYVGPRPSALVRPHLSALDIVVTGLHASFVDTRWHHYQPGDWQRAEWCLERLHAAELAQRRYESLSEGEKKRVLIARSLMADPDLLVLDEPGTALDLGARERLVESLSGLAADPAAPSSLLVTHHVEEIPPGYHHILMLASGKVVASGSIDQVLTAATLSDTFGMRLQVARFGQRWRAWSESEGSGE
ncbi:MAG TPA: ABC transporter ATP-binding protein [Acidimicrobiia bacterium]|nr:ABC transporter ATP-binding protein [Acidimicrobiia bacterium]